VSALFVADIVGGRRPFLAYLASDTRFRGTTRFPELVNVYLLREHGAEWIFKCAWIYPCGQIQCDDTENSLPSLFHRVNQIWLKFKLKCTLSLPLSPSLRSAKLNHAEHARACDRTCTTSAASSVSRIPSIARTTRSFHREINHVVTLGPTHIKVSVDPRGIALLTLRNMPAQHCYLWMNVLRFREISRYRYIRYFGDTLSIDCELSLSRE